MLFDAILNPLVQQFIRDNEDANISQLLLQGKDVEGVAIRDVVEQIVSRKKAKTKTPFLYECPNVVFPPKISMEQCSSQITAEYKQQLVSGKRGADVTGGAGIDAYYLSKGTEKFDYIEQNEVLVQLVTQNFKHLGANQIHTHTMTAEEFINNTSDHYDFIYLDPSRRDTNKRKVFLFADCVPNIVSMKNTLLQRADKVIVKASPLVDIKQGIEELTGVEEIHVVAVENECKELLFVLSNNIILSPRIVCVNYKKEEWEHFKFELGEEESVQVNFAMPQTFLYEPNASILKAGAFKSVANHFKLNKLHPNSHLYTSTQKIENFPGRVFEIAQILKYDKKTLLKALPQNKANIACRNFPDSVEQIRKKTKIKEGGDHYLFATTNMENEKIILLTKK